MAGGDQHPVQPLEVLQLRGIDPMVIGVQVNNGVPEGGGDSPEAGVAGGFDPDGTGAENIEQ